MPRTSEETTLAVPSLLETVPRTSSMWLPNLFAALLEDLGPENDLGVPGLFLDGYEHRAVLSLSPNPPTGYGGGGSGRDEGPGIGLAMT